MTEYEADELIARLSTENANLLSTNAALADHRVKLLSENANLQEHKQCLDTWLDKTAWAQSAPWAAQYLGLHRADGMRQRIEALERELEIEKDATTVANNEAVSWKTAWGKEFDKAAELEAKLEAMQEQKPVAYRAWFDADNGARWLFTLWTEEEKLDVEWEPLYTHPAQPEHKPLTPKEINRIYHEHEKQLHLDGWLIPLVRDIEAAHGIKETT